MEQINATLPEFAVMEDWIRISGIRRSSSYELIAAGHLKAVKSGKRLLVDVRHGLAYLRSLPPAQIRPSRPKKEAA